MIFVHCKAHGVEFRQEGKLIWTAHNREELAALGRASHTDLQLMCGSSLDWPEDVTDDLDLIDVCNLIRGNTIRQDEINAMLKERNNG